MPPGVKSDLNDDVIMTPDQRSGTRHKQDADVQNQEAASEAAAAARGRKEEERVRDGSRQLPLTHRRGSTVPPAERPRPHPAPAAVRPKTSGLRRDRSPPAVS